MLDLLRMRKVNIKFLLIFYRKTLFFQSTLLNHVVISKQTDKKKKRESRCSLIHAASVKMCPGLFRSVARVPF